MPKKRYFCLLLFQFLSFVIPSIYLSISIGWRQLTELLSAPTALAPVLLGVIIYVYLGFRVVRISVGKAPVLCDVDSGIKWMQRLGIWIMNASYVVLILTVIALVFILLIGNLGSGNGAVSGIFFALPVYGIALPGLYVSVLLIELHEIINHFKKRNYRNSQEAGP